MQFLELHRQFGNIVKLFIAFIESIHFFLDLVAQISGIQADVPVGTVFQPVIAEELAVCACGFGNTVGI